MVQVVEILPAGRQRHMFIHIEDCDCWWLGNARSQGITSHGTDHFISEYSEMQTFVLNKMQVIISCAKYGQQSAILFLALRFNILIRLLSYQRIH